MTGKAPKGEGYTIRGVIFLYVAGTLWQTSLMWQRWLNVNEYQGQHLIGCPFSPPSVEKCQLDNAAVCHPAAHSSLIPP